MRTPSKIHIVYANWCPHCVPTAVEPLKARAEELGIACALHDIDTDEVEAADALVKDHGDWTPDYLIPQVFLEYEGGAIEHVLTGDPRGVSLTSKAVAGLLDSDALQPHRAAPK